MTDKKLLRIALVAALGMAAPLAVSTSAFAQQPSAAKKEEASNRFKKGIELFNEGDYRAALVEFRRAYELAPHWGVLYNIGQVHFQLQDYPAALSALERYLSDGGRNVPAKRRTEVEGDIAKLKSRVALVDLKTNVSDGELVVDDVTVQKLPVTKPVMVSAGRHRIAISRDGRVVAAKTIEIASGDTLDVTLDAAEPTQGGTPVGPVGGDNPKNGNNGDPVTQPDPPVQPDKPEPSGGGFPWLAWGITAGIGAGAGVFGILALTSASDLEDKRESPGQTRDKLDSAQTQTTTFAIVSDVLSVATIVAGGVSIYLTVKSSSSEGAASSKSSGSSVAVGITGNGVRLAGSF